MEVNGGDRGRFAFVTCGSFSGINAQVEKLLAEGFPELEVDTVDVPSWARRQPGFLVLNTALSVLRTWKRPPRSRGALWGVFFRSPYLFRRVRRLMAARHARGPYRFSFQTQSLFDASIAGVPHFIYTDHTALAQTYYPDFVPAKAPGTDWLAREREIYEHSTLIFTMSEHVSRSLIEHYGVPPEKVRRVLAGSNVSPGTDGAGANDYTSKRILFVGRDWGRKGGPDLVRAFREVRQLHPDATLRVVGCSPDVQEEGMSAVGELSPDDVERELQNATVFCMPTLREPFGLAFVEALNHGVPVVATDIGAVPDVVSDGESGYLVRPHDVDGLTVGLDRLLSSAERCERFGAAGRASVRTRYNWPRVVNAMVAEIRAQL